MANDLERPVSRPTTLTDLCLASPLLVRVLLFALLYLGSVQSAFLLSFPVTNFLTFWPPSGLFVTALILFPLREWPVFCAGAYAATTVLDLIHGRAGLTSQLYILGNAAEALTGAGLVRLFCPRPTMHRLKDVTILIVGAGLTGTALCATIGITVNTLLLGGGSFISRWFLWWSSNILGVLVVAPVSLCLMNKSWRPRDIHWRRVLEFFALAALMAATSWIVAKYVPTWGHFGILATPLLTWAALRFGPLGASGMGAFLAFTIVWMGSHGHVPIAGHTSGEVWPLQAYLAVAQSVGLVLAAIFAEREAGRLALRRDEERLREAQRIARMGSFVRNLQDGSGSWSDELFRLFGYEPGEVPDSHELFRQHVHPDDAASVAQSIAAALADRKPYEFECRYVPRGGETHYAHIVSRIVRDAQGTPLELHGILQDITERKALEERLLQSEKMEAVGQLAGGVAHDFNNMLTAILGSAEMILREAPAPETRQHAESIVKASLRSADLAQKLLAFARKGKYVSIPFNLHAVIGEVVTLLEHSIDKRITIRQLLEASPSSTSGDPAQIQNALLNLALNARDAMPEGGTLTFETKVMDLDASHCRARPYDISPGRYIRINVVDTGIGMDKEVMKHLFEPFFTTKKAGQGTGLGLAAVYGAVRSHHGAVSVYSEPGRGSTFRVYLPLLATPADEAAPRPEPKLHAGREHILLVDDESVVRNVAARMLQELGYRVTACQDGAEGVAVYRDSWREVDLVILDMVMPRMGGKETFRAMRAINPAVKVLLSSGYSLNGEAQSILDEGVLGFLEKPFGIAELSGSVAKVLRKESPAT